jgi:CBS domain-containing protein
MPKAKDLMTSGPVTCSTEDSVASAARLMKQKDIGIIPVLDEQNRCRGVITDRDICIRVVAENLNPESTRLSQVMSEALLTCSPEDDLEDVLAKMENKQVKRILVVGDRGCVGVISEADIAREAKDVSKVGELASNVYR